MQHSWIRPPHDSSAIGMTSGGTRFVGIDSDVADALVEVNDEHPWPGNRSTASCGMPANACRRSLAAAQTPNGFEQGQVQQVAFRVTSADFPRDRRNGAEQLGCPSIVSPSERDEGAAGRKSDEAGSNAIAGIVCLTSQERDLPTTPAPAVPCAAHRRHGVHITEGAKAVFDMLGPGGTPFQA